MRSWTYAPRDRFFEFGCAHIPLEVRPANTVVFQAEVDLTEVEQIRARAAAAGERRPTYTAFVVQAVAAALREFPYANRGPFPALRPFGRPRLVQFGARDIAVACERELPGTQQATFVDVLRNADELPLGRITAWLDALARCDETNNAQWRGFKTAITRLPGRLAARFVRLQAVFPSLWARYRGAAVLISSPAKYGVDAVSATWPWPLGISFGLVKMRAVVRDGLVVARPTFRLTLAFDRRVMVGAPAAKFFGRLVEILENAQKEFSQFPLHENPPRHSQCGVKETSRFLG